MKRGKWNVTRTLVSDPLGNSGLLLQKGTQKEPVFIIKKAEIQRSKPNSHELDEKAIARNVTLDWRGLLRDSYEHES